MAYDLVIRNGTVVDGSGLGSYRADVGIVGDRIAFVGRIRERGLRELDADGHVVTPGFVDGHTHLDAQVFWDATGSSSCFQGVTTAVMGNCGFTLAPVRSEERALVVRNLERAEDIDPVALAEGIEWTFETFPEYLDAVDGLAKGINFAANVGHSALRTWAMGERAFTEKANDDDLYLMRGQLEESIRAGAIGFTTSRSQHHETSDNRPVASRLAAWDEVVQLVNVMGDLGAGIFEGADAGMSSPDPELRARSRQRMTDLSVSCGVPLTFGFVATRAAGPLLGIAQRSELVRNGPRPKRFPAREEVERDARLERQQHRDAAAMGLRDDARSRRGGIVEVVEQRARGASGDVPEGERHTTGHRQIGHPLQRPGALLGIGRRHSRVGAFEDAGAEVAHHVDELHDFVPRRDARRNRTIVRCLVVLAARRREP
ncbi:MAG TPA: amidohydrolase family protein, partial [Acidimicrobiia bacterium]|nr:amidohydrolase family protein [Acidimicrobiia bacterium]